MLLFGTVWKRLVLPAVVLTVMGGILATSATRWVVGAAGLMNTLFKKGR